MLLDKHISCSTPQMMMTTRTCLTSLQLVTHTFTQTSI
jgi:hypothetical protein